MSDLVNNENLVVLGIESSCDETAAAVVRGGREVLSNVIYSQIDIHTLYGGVVPEIASRKHIEKVDTVIRKAIDDSSLTLSDIDVIAVTYGPGLVGPLLVGVSAAKGLSYAAKKPLVGVNHIEGHIAANYIEHPDLKPPFLSLVVSGGHTHLIRVKDYAEYEIHGYTRDDAAGEAFDKVARAIGLGYPGGPKINKEALKGNPHAYEFPRAKTEGSLYDFSFSGVKSAVLNFLNAAKMKGEEINVPDVAASFQQAVIDVLVEHTINCAKNLGEEKVCVAGGVASNTALRELFTKRGKEEGIEIIYPSGVYCTDNAVMIACQGYYRYLNGDTKDLSLNAIANLKIGS